MPGKTGPITETGKAKSKVNAIKHGLYLNLCEFFPCNLCIYRDSCDSFEQGGLCKLDKKHFDELMGEELDIVQTLEMLIRLNIVRLNRAIEQLNKEPHNIELTKISAEIRQELQALFVIKRRVGVYGREIEAL